MEEQNPPKDSHSDINSLIADTWDELTAPQKFILDNAWESIPGGYRRWSLPGAE